MSVTTIDEKLIEALEDAHALEASVLRMLDSMQATTTDPVVLKLLAKHQTETEQHEERLRKRLDKIAGGRSRKKDLVTQVGALMKGFGDLARSDKPMKNARDGFMVEHLEIATYELLERLAVLAGDKQTAEICRRNRADEVRMAAAIAENWDRFLELTITEERVAVV